jgi:hypothetical protein
MVFGALWRAIQHGIPYAELSAMTHLQSYSGLWPVLPFLMILSGSGLPYKKNIVVH